MEAIFFDFGIVVLLLIISAFFSASETGITAASRAKIHKLKMEGNRRAKLVSKLRQEKEKLIGGILFGNNVVNIAASAITTSLFLKLFGDDGVYIATAVVTVLVVIFGEVMPKTYALTFPEKVAMRVAPLLSLIVTLFAPITHTVQFLVSRTFRIFRISQKNDNDLSGADALRGAIELQLQEGGVVKNDRDMLGSILDLSEMEVGEIMIHRKQMDMLRSDMPTEAIIDFVLSTLHTRIPVYSDSPDNIIGILHAKELLKLLKRGERKSLTTDDILKMLKKPWFIPETTTLRDQLHAFMKARNHLAIVIDEYGSVLGLVTLEDILEEIVGQIDDEHDSKSAVAKKEMDGSYLVEGGATLRDINRELDWKLPDDNATTIAGLVIHEAQSIPDIGQSFAFHGFHFQVMKKQRNQITLLRVKKLLKVDAPNG